MSEVRKRMDAWLELAIRLDDQNVRVSHLENGGGKSYRRHICGTDMQYDARAGLFRLIIRLNDVIPAPDAPLGSEAGTRVAAVDTSTMPSAKRPPLTLRARLGANDANGPLIEIRVDSE